MPTKVYLDNNVWDFLFKRDIDVCRELPANEFEICITREAEFEIDAIPPEKEELRAFIAEALQRCVEAKVRFGFHDDRHSEADQRVGGFDVGGLVSVAEHEFHARHRSRQGSKKKDSTRLYGNEADLALAAASFDAVVLTLDKKPGPLREAHDAGGQVVFLNEFVHGDPSLADLVRARISPRDDTSVQ